MEQILLIINKNGIINVKNTITSQLTDQYDDIQL